MAQGTKKYAFMGVNKGIGMKYEDIIKSIKKKKPELKSDAKVIEYALQNLYEDTKFNYVRIPKEYVDLLFKQVFKVDPNELANKPDNFHLKFSKQFIKDIKKFENDVEKNKK